MGFMDKFSKVFGSDKAAVSDVVKGPSATLRDNGIDPSNLQFSFNRDGSVAVSGQVASQSECDRICQVVEGIPNVKGVQNKMIVGAPAPTPVSEPEVAVQETEIGADGTAETEAEVAGRTYTVQSGDTLWAIAEKMYGSGGKYMKIFEANTSILENPDKIFPGQELVIPDSDGS